MNQQKIIQIRFGVDEAAGELKFRTFRSSEPINNKMFIVLSKLTADNRVNYEFIGADGRGPVTLNKGTVDMAEFFNQLGFFEATLRAKNPRVRLLEDNDNHLMLTNHDGIEGGKITKEMAAELLQQMESGDLSDILKTAPSSNRLKKYF